MSSLDAQSSKEITSASLNSHLLNLDSLLNLDETIDWVRYAVQLPQEIADAFLANHVTGTEFPELIENDALAIKSSLGIQNAMHVKKLVKHIRIKLLGVGAAPGDVKGFGRDGEDGGCEYAGFSWDKADAVRLEQAQRKGKKSCLFFNSFFHAALIYIYIYTHIALIKLFSCTRSLLSPSQQRVIVKVRRDISDPQLPRTAPVEVHVASRVA